MCQFETQPRKPTGAKHEATIPEIMIRNHPLIFIQSEHMSFTNNSQSHMRTDYCILFSPDPRLHFKCVNIVQDNARKDANEIFINT